MQNADNLNAVRQWKIENQVIPYRLAPQPRLNVVAAKRISGTKFAYQAVSRFLKTIRAQAK